MFILLFSHFRSYLSSSIMSTLCSPTPPEFLVMYNGALT